MPGLYLPVAFAVHPYGTQLLDLMAAATLHLLPAMAVWCDSTDSFLTGAGQASAGTSQPPSADPTAPPTTHAADFLSNRLAKDPSPPPQPAVQPPAAVKKKQYQAEPAPAPAPAVDSDGVAESDEGAQAAAVAVSAWSAAEKQVGTLPAASLHILCICMHFPGRCITSRLTHTQTMPAKLFVRPPCCILCQ